MISRAARTVAAKAAGSRPMRSAPARMTPDSNSTEVHVTDVPELSPRDAVPDDVLHLDHDHMEGAVRPFGTSVTGRPEPGRNISCKARSVDASRTTSMIFRIRSAAGSDGRVALRDTEQPDAEPWVLRPAVWDKFVAGAKNGIFDF